MSKIAAIVVMIAATTLAFSTTADAHGHHKGHGGHAGHHQHR